MYPSYPGASTMACFWRHSRMFSSMLPELCINAWPNGRCIGKLKHGDPYWLGDVGMYMGKLWSKRDLIFSCVIPLLPNVLKIFTALSITALTHIGYRPWFQKGRSQQLFHKVDHLFHSDLECTYVAERSFSPPFRWAACRWCRCDMGSK